MKLTYQKNNAFKGLHGLNAQISYSYSSFKNSGGGPGRQRGRRGRSPTAIRISSFLRSTTPTPTSISDLPCSTDPQQFSFGVVGTLPWNFQASFIGHFYSSLPVPIIVPGSGPGAIFQNDFTGDGTTQDPLPGTLNGAFGRQVSARYA